MMACILGPHDPRYRYTPNDVILQQLDWIRVGQGRIEGVSLGRLKWLTIILPLIFVATVQLCVIIILEPVLGSPAGHWLAFAIIAVGVIVFASTVFNVLGKQQRKILKQNEEAQALFAIGLEIASLQDVQKILRSIVEQARGMLGSETAALCLAGGNGGGLTLVDCSGPKEAFQRLPAPVPPFPLTLDTEGEDLAAPAGRPCTAIDGRYRACHLSAPLVVGNSRVGELCVAGRAARQV